MECFTKIQKMADKMKVLEKHLEILSQLNLKMESLQVKIEELDKWRNMENNVPSSLPAVKSYDIRLHTLSTSECQELASIFGERATQNLARMMELYENLSMISKDTFSGLRSTSHINIQFLFPSSKSSKIDMKRSRRGFKQRKSYSRKTSNNF